MIFNSILAGLTFSASVISLITLIGMVNQMTHKTNHFIRAGVLVLSSGDFNLAAQILILNCTPTVSETLLSVGAAIYLTFNRRQPVFFYKSSIG